MRRFLVALAVLFVGLAAVPPVRGDELVEAARKERARREEVRKRKGGDKHAEDGAKPKVLDNNRLRKVAGTAGKVSEVKGKPGEGDAAGAPARSASDASAGKEAAGAAEASWRARLGEAKQKIQAGRQKVIDLNQRINNLRREAASIDDPNVRTRKAAELLQAEAELPAAQSAAAESDRAVDQLQEDARKDGVPPGWVR